MKSDKLFVALAALVVLATLALTAALYGTIGYVVLHFIKKLW